MFKGDPGGRSDRKIDVKRGSSPGSCAADPVRKIFYNKNEKKKLEWEKYI